MLLQWMNESVYKLTKYVRLCRIPRKVSIQGSESSHDAYCVIAIKFGISILHKTILLYKYCTKNSNEKN